MENAEKNINQRIPFKAGVGIDLCETAGFESRPFFGNEKFYKKFFTGKEIKYCLSKFNPPEHFAARFAAKEAMIKAGNLKLKDLKKIEIINMKNGAPRIHCGLVGRRKKIISLSHAKNAAIAIVILC